MYKHYIIIVYHRTIQIYDKNTYVYFTAHIYHVHNLIGYNIT